MITNRSNTSTTVVTSILAVVVVGAAGAAEFESFEAELVNPVTQGWDLLGYDDSLLDTYRIYATFDAPSRVISVGDVPNDGINLTLTTGDGLLWNSAFGGNTPATMLVQDFSPDTRWDTYVTVGATTGDDVFISLSPPFDEQTNSLAGDFVLNNAGWGTPGNADNGLTVDGRVLIAQFTVANGIAIDGTDWLVFYRTDPSNPGTLTSAVGNFSIPAPSGLALLAGLAAARRRRRR